MAEYKIIVVSRDNCLAAYKSGEEMEVGEGVRLSCEDQHRAVRILHAGAMTEEFDDLEEIEIWVRMVGGDVVEAAKSANGSADPYAAHGFYAYFVLSLLDHGSDVKVDGSLLANRYEVVGGLSLEFYEESRVGLMAYVAVLKDHRAHGLARRMVECSRGVIDAEAQRITGQPAKMFTIFVVPPADEANPDADGGASRQVVWTKLGFRPIEGYSIVFPGRLRGEPHQVAIHAPQLANKEETATVATSDLAKYVLTVFGFILAEEDNFTDKNGEIAHEGERFRSLPPMLRYGLQFWHPVQKVVP